MFHACLRLLYHDWTGHSRKNRHSGAVCTPAGKTAGRYSKMQPHSGLFHNKKGWCFSIPERTFHFFHRVFHRFCEKKTQFPTRFSTFSTGFSTWKSGFAYTSRNAARRSMPVSGKKSGHFAFYIKESRRIFFSFYSSFRLTDPPLSRLEKRSPEFSTAREHRFFVWKKWGKLWFSTVCRLRQKAAPYLVFWPPLCYNVNRGKNEQKETFP